MAGTLKRSRPIDRFRGSSGVTLSFTCDDFTDPWKQPSTLLLLHAAMGSAKRWYAAVPKLARHYRVIRMDLRGHGESEVPSPDSPLTMDCLVQDVRELLDHVGAGQVHVVGNSAGGYLAQNLAMQSPERVRSLVLFGSTPGLKESQAHTWLPRVAREGLRNFLAATISDRFPAGHDAGHIQWFLDEAAKNDPAWIGRFIGLMTTLWWMDELPRIQCPTLLVVPGAETVGHAGNYQKMQERIADCELISYPGLPHNICDIVPERCAADVLAFLRRRFPGDAA
jgi:3-oxoadipate enol-lactonase